MYFALFLPSCEEQFSFWKIALKKILLLSGYDAASHQYWRKLLADKLSQYQWTQLALADRNYAWRVRGSSLNFAFQFSEEISKDYDLIIATSMVDFASLKGFVPHLASIPSIVYFHENQFVYPLSQKDKKSELNANAISAQLTSIYSALCADKILFNSQYNLTSFISGAANLFKRLPDKFPDSLLAKIENNSQVLSVPLETVEASSNDFIKNKIPHILWNHRWEYDKQPEVFFDALLKLKNAGFLFKLHVLGQSFRNVPACFAQAKLDFADEIESFGFQSKQVYQQILQQADIVVSTALHDFQGLSIMQAINHGCFPIAPNRVAYPEYIPSCNLYAISDDPKLEANNLYLKLVEVVNNDLYKASHNVNISKYSVESLIAEYQIVFESMMGK